MLVTVLPSISSLNQKNIDNIRQKCIRDALVGFRVGISAEMFTKIDTKQVTLLLGRTGVEENEKHLCFRCSICSMYDNFIPAVMKYIEPYQDSAQLVRLMFSKQDGTIRKIAWHLFEAFWN